MKVWLLIISFLVVSCSSLNYISSRKPSSDEKNKDQFLSPSSSAVSRLNELKPHGYDDLFVDVSNRNTPSFWKVGT